MMLISNKFEIGELVYLSTDEDQKRRLIAGLKVCPDGLIVYFVSCGTAFSEHYEFEITEEVNTIIKTTN